MQILKNEADDLISRTTAENWRRLQTEPSQRLTARANKKRSTKNFLPEEYFLDKKNIPFVKNLLQMIFDDQADIYSVIFSLGVNLLERRGIYSKPHVQKILHEYADAQPLKEFLTLELPANEFDLLGIIYQSYLQEGKKNLRGAYYTPKKIVGNITRHFDFSGGKNFLDPCCGSGAFLIKIPAENPNQLYGLDNDKIAVLAAKVNLLLKYSAIEFLPQIYCLDFLDAAQNHFIFNKKFDYIATNPPWGAVAENFFKFDAVYKETFAIFFVKAYQQLKRGGTIRFLFPEAVLNVIAHKNLRNFILNAGLVAVTKYTDNFSGVVTKYVDIECGNSANKNFFKVFSDNVERRVETKTAYETKNLIFNFATTADREIIRAIKVKGNFSLSKSSWALGIVTGDNKNKVLSSPQPDAEKIFTGKEIQPFKLAAAKRWLVYDRNNFQQTARDEIYRAPEKLVYKFISRKLVFAYDDKQNLFLNSANILIPAVPNMNIKSVMAFLNSALFNFMYIKLFGGVKVLKSHLLELPLPKISPPEDNYLKNLVDKILCGENRRAELDRFIFNFYEISAAQEKYIRRVFNGDVD